MAMWSRARAAAARIFYQYFFRLLLVMASAAQWVVVAWVAWSWFQRALPWWLDGIAVAVLYLFNRQLTFGPRRRGWLLRTYTATAFVAIVCSIFLLATTLVFLVADGVLGVLSAQALSEAGQATLGAGLDGAFRWTATLGMTVIALAMGYGYVLGHGELRETRIPLLLSNWPRQRRPLRVAQISDIHVGQNLTLPQLRRFVERVNASAPDLICITGDITDSPRADFATFFPVLAELRATYGVCAILGNHDHYAGAARVMAELRSRTAFHVLRDSAVTLDLDGTPLHVVGLDDRGRDWARGVQSDARLAELLEAAPADTPLLLLSHRPDIFRQAAAAAVPLNLSGHKNGGQLAMPWFGGRRLNLADFVTDFSRGLYRAGDSYLYVNCGLGVTGQRIRLFTPREISLFELTAA
jgi:uncharacterized protein